ncbi:VCBS repeat-containing protein [Maribacter cobaltidurans]|uniref:VCBS repeat-containing protein n=1 Tax=Maribacter cobaltidurans TaxID=1178778 RepID=UPI0013150A0C|nr:VCBS repeat-containing protein [Maribacter cobaltidurans]
MNIKWFDSLSLKKVLLGCIALIILFACSEGTEQPTLFKLVSNEYSGIKFNNQIQPFESDTLNALEYDVLFNGGGVGIGDFNGDGLQDVFFAGNLVSSKLYLNRGNLKFVDVTEEAKVSTNKWCTGVSVTDVNQDGLLDVYLSVANATGSKSDKSNLLYINQGNNEKDIPSFKESSEEYGLADDGFSIQSAFFDYDKDGDLDCYILSNAMEKTGRNQLHRKKNDGQSPSNDRLYQNIGIENGHPIFKNVTLSAGIVKEGHGLGLCITDLNQDGWLDVYCANDFVSNDVIWINNHDGTFIDKSAEFLKHTSYNSMGVDIQDFNNDGLPDICVVDMLPELEQRRKMMVMKTSRDFFRIAENLGYQDEYVRNVLQLNQGKNNHGSLQFSEIGQLAGVHATDWSWAPLLADFDNDGLKDLMVTNGYRRDITNLDYAVYLNQAESFHGMSEEEARGHRIKKLYELPEMKMQNYIYRNNGDLTFSNVSNAWGLQEKTYSNGAAYADLDNDGDLDLVINNIDSEASLYRNELISSDSTNHIDANDNAHFVRLKLKADTDENKTVGAKVKIQLPSGEIKYQENLPVRGYMSSVDPVLSFGLGNNTTFAVEVTWTDDKVQRIENLTPDALHVITYAPQEGAHPVIETDEQTVFQLLNADSLGLTFKHEEYPFDEFKRTFSLHQQYNQLSPGLAIGDMDGNGLDDIFIGADSKRLRSIYLQKKPGHFEALPQGENNMEDMGALLFDADNDGDKDLYVVSGGSVNLKDKDYIYNDRLYLNDGNGRMVRSENLIPNTLFSGSVVVAADFDRDGDLDLFRGSRVSAGEYPSIPDSYLLRNDDGVFKDVTKDLGNGLQKTGMVSAALWTDYNQDGWYDLVVVGEFMPITFYKNQNGKLVKDEEATLPDSNGWWNSITAGDFDQDGDIDYIAGNLGLNSQYKASIDAPIRVYGSDFDGNGSIDPIITYSKESRDVPVAVRDVMHEQMTSIINKRFGSYDAYSRASIHDIFDDVELKEAKVLSAVEMRSCYIENSGNSKFVFRPLPIEAQIAPIFGSLAGDFNSDGFLDVLLIGNSDAFETYTGPYNASMGTLLRGNGKGGFSYVPQQKSGLYLQHDQKALGVIRTGKEDLIVLTNNNAETQLLRHSVQENGKYVSLSPNEASLQIILSNGKTERREIGYGGGYLTQSSRGFLVPKYTKEIHVFDFSGKRTRTIDPTEV